MSNVDHSSGATTSPGPVTPTPNRPVPRIPVVALAMSLGLFLAFTFTLCVLFDLLVPDQAMYETWFRLLPGFTWLS